MPDTQRQQIMAALGARLATIRTANGYRTNIGASVLEDPVDEQEPGDLPVVMYRDTDAATVAEMSRHHHTISIEIGVTMAGATPLPEIRKVCDDVAKAIGVDPSFGALAITAAPPSSGWDVYGDGADLVTGIIFKFTIEYRTTEWTT